MHYGLTEIQGSPAPDPLLTLSEAKLHCRIDVDAEDSLVQANVLAATRWAEQYTRRVFVSREFELTLDDFPRKAWIDSHAPQDEEAWPPRFGSLTQSTRFPEAIVLPIAPLVSLESITYASTTLEGSPEEPVYKTVEGVIDKSSWPPRIHPKFKKCWPEVSRVPEAVTVKFSAGYGEPGDVPDDIKQAVKLILGSFYEHREDQVVASVMRVPFNAEALLSPYRLFRL